MGIEGKGQVVLMIHCGSRGFGHQVFIAAQLLYYWVIAVRDDTSHPIMLSIRECRLR